MSPDVSERSFEEAIECGLLRYGPDACVGDATAVREVRSRVGRPGFRTRSVVVVTTPLDPAQATRGGPAALYRARWNAELDLRSLKAGLKMGELRGQTPDMVREEVWAHVLAYNLVRAVMAQAAARGAAARSGPRTPVLGGADSFPPGSRHRNRRSSLRGSGVCARIWR